MSLHELKDDKSEEKWENGEKSSKRCDRKVVEKHRHISRSTRSRFSCLKFVKFSLKSLKLVLVILIFSEMWLRIDSKLSQAKIHE